MKLSAEENEAGWTSESYLPPDWSRFMNLALSAEWGQARWSVLGVVLKLILMIEGHGRLLVNLKI